MYNYIFILLCIIHSTIGCIMVITSLLSIIFEENVTKWHVVAAISINLALGDFAYSGGFFPTLLDLAPNYAGLLSGVSTFIAFVVACPATYVNSIIIKQVRKQIHIIIKTFIVLL